MKIRWTERALEDLTSIGRYIGRHDREAARRLVSRLRLSVRRLKDYPYSGRVVPEFEREELREVLEGSYRVVYQVDEEGILIVSVFESHRLFPEEEKE